jgi:serine/threonine protein kinase
MGVVYQAEDLRLHRMVALKFLPDDRAKDPQALGPFQREAPAASALNHGNLCTIYDLGEPDGRAFTATEFLDGQTLRARIDGKPMPLEQTLANIEKACAPGYRDFASIETSPYLAAIRPVAKFQPR